MKAQAAPVVRQAGGSGRWFPADAEQLKSMVDGFVDAAKVRKTDGRIVGAIAPHAGYVYSGKVAGYAFRAIRDAAAAGYAPETVVVLGLSHRGPFRGVALMDGDAFQTPLGVTPLDAEATAALAAAGSRLFLDARPHMAEHSAENEVPFLQTVLPDAKLVLGLIGDHDAETLDELLAALTALAGRRKILVVASTDLLHHADYGLVTRTDRETLAKIAALDHEGLARTWSYGNQVCCGIGPVLTVMRFAAAQGCSAGTVLHYRNSGDDFPDSRGSWVVGYGAVVFARPGD